MKKKIGIVIGIILIVVCTSIALLMHSNYLRNEKLIAKTDTQQSELQIKEKSTQNGNLNNLNSESMVQPKINTENQSPEKSIENIQNQTAVAQSASGDNEAKIIGHDDVSDEECETLEKAIEKFQENDGYQYIELLKDINRLITVNTDDKAVIDLNNHKMLQGINNKGNLEIKDDDGQGEVNSKITNDGELTITSGKIKNDTDVAIETSNTLNINGGYIESQQSDAIKNSESINMTEGHIASTESAAIRNTSSNAQINISGGTITSTSNVAIVCEEGSIYVDQNANINGYIGGISGTKGNVEIKSGTVKSDTESAIEITDQGVLTLGINDESVSTDLPSIEGYIEVNEEADFYFYDGKIQENGNTGGAIKGKTPIIPSGYYIQIITSEDGRQTVSLAEITTDIPYPKTTEKVSNPQMGDVNQDGLITGYDSYLVLRYGAGKVIDKNFNVNLADMNGDGLFDAGDTRIIDEKAMGIDEMYNYIAIGEKQLVACIDDSGNTTDNVEWSTDNSQIATIDNTGKLTALKAGQVTITAKNKTNQIMKSSFKVEVQDTTESSKPIINVSDISKNWTNKDIVVTADIIGNPLAIEKVEYTGDFKKVDELEKNHKYQFTIEKNQNFTIKATNQAGEYTERQISITTIDKDLPEITGIEDGETYSKAVKVEVKDSLSGIKEVTLTKDGKNVQFTSGTQLSENGEYVLNATDNAGNSKKVSFKIKINGSSSQEGQDGSQSGDDGDNDKESIPSESKDKTVASKILPDTGIKNIVIAIVVMIMVGTVFFIKNKKYKDIK